MKKKGVFKFIPVSVLLILLVLAGLKWFAGWCSIWLCVIFMIVLLSYWIYDDITTKEENE